MYKRILVATDGSKLSKMAVEHAINLADLTGAEVVALKVVPRYPQTYFRRRRGPGRCRGGPHREAMAGRGHGSRQCGQVAGQAREVKVKPVTVKSDLIAEAIIAAAKRNKCDLIVMASHGRKGLKRLLLGSETQQVLTHSHTPVLVRLVTGGNASGPAEPVPPRSGFESGELAPGELVFVLLAQQVLLHLAHGVAGQLAHHEAALGNLEVGQRVLSSAMTCSGSSGRPARQSPPPPPPRRKSGCGTPTTALSATPGSSLMKPSISAG
jgi:nucleotide-binding universal stress UspA family protein